MISISIDVKKALCKFNISHCLQTCKNETVYYEEFPSPPWESTSECSRAACGASGLICLQESSLSLLADPQVMLLSSVLLEHSLISFTMGLNFDKTQE